jgi:hypothetical protein
MERVMLLSGEAIMSNRQMDTHNFVGGEGGEGGGRGRYNKVTYRTKSARRISIYYSTAITNFKVKNPV